MASMIQRLFQQIRHENVKMNTFQQGQIFFGKITKLFPRQLAEVIVGKQKMIATIETPLEQNGHYWFQVQIEHGKIHLKVLTINQGGESEKQISSPKDILTKLGLPHSKEYLLLVRLFMNEQFALTKEMLTVAMEWLCEQEDITNRFNTVKEVLLRRLPFTPSVLSAIHCIMYGEPFHVLMANLLIKLENDPQITSVKNLTSLLTRFTESITDLLSERVVIGILEKWLLGTEAEQKAAFKLLQSIDLFSKTSSEKDVLERIYRNITLLELEHEGNQTINFIKNPGSFLQSFLPLFQVAEQEQQRQLLQQLTVSNQPVDDLLQPFIKKHQNHSLLTNFESIPRLKRKIDQATSRLLKIMLRKMWEAHLTSGDDGLLKGATEEGKEVLRVLIGTSHIESEVLKQMSKRLITAITMKESKAEEAYRNPELQLLDSLGRSLIEGSMKWENVAYIRRAFQELFYLLGLHFEYELGQSSFSDNRYRKHIPETLKPMLIRYLQIPNVSGKSEAEQLLHRLIGMQLLSQETGPLQQVIMQIPLRLRKKTIDLTMQWSGRKTETGQIDPDHCRILFYLYLPHLKRTIIDMHVQNRIINLFIFTETDSLNEISTPFMIVLKNNLEELNYKISDVTFQPLEKKIETDSFSPRFPANRPYTGVDIRI